MTLRELAKKGSYIIMNDQKEKWNLDDLYGNYAYEENSMLDDDVSEYEYWKHKNVKLLQEIWSSYFLGEQDEFDSILIGYCDENMNLVLIENGEFHAESFWQEYGHVFSNDLKVKIDRLVK